MKVCLEPGCPELCTTTRCVSHTRQRDRQRGSSTARGYGAAHRGVRAELQREMDAGVRFTCWRCGDLINPGAWDLGHRDDRSGYAGPECVPCNRATASRRDAADPRGMGSTAIHSETAGEGARSAEC